MSEQLTQAQRDNYIYDSQRIALETLRIPEVQRRLGGYSSGLYALTQSAVPLSVENGMITTDEASSTALPVTVARAGEEVIRKAADEPFDAFQLESMGHKYGDAESRLIIDGYQRAYKGKSIPIPAFDKQLAYTHTLNIINGHDDKVVGRPLVSFNYDRSTLPYVDAPIWFHEFTHAEQARKLPVWNSAEALFDEQDLSGELEGYSVAAMTILGIQDAGRQSELLASIPHDSLERTLEIEAIREHANKYEINPYAATKDVASELIKNGHGITKFLKEQVTSK